MHIPKIIQTVSDALRMQDAKAIVVGGSVRDHFLHLPIKDYDVEVYGLREMGQLEAILSVHGQVNLVGKSFGVLKFVHEGEEYDFSFPRRESKVGEGHRGFEVAVDGEMGFEEAARRRDFTLNAMGYDVEAGAFIDPFGAQKDMRERVLRHIDDATFVEDPLRVYRAVQFAARFGYALADETFVLCKLMVEGGMLDELPKERVYAEWNKLLLKSDKPSIGFNLMRDLGITPRYSPELHALIGVPQSPEWHPEGDVWVHTMMAVDAMVTLLGDDEKRNLRYLFAILCHDLGKATHTTIDADGRIRAIGHEEAGVAPTRSLMYRLTDEHDFIESLLPLVEHHLKPSQFYKNGAKAPAIRRLATKVNIQELVTVAKADFLGRMTEESLAGAYPAGEWLLAKAQALRVDKKPLENILRGQDLIDLGLDPSPQFKEILDVVYARQLDGKIGDKEEAIVFVKKEYLWEVSTLL